MSNQSRSQSPRSSVGGIVRLWEKAQKNARNSLHSITIGSSTLGKRALFIWLKMAAVQRVENDDAGKNYNPSSFKNSCPGTKTSDHIESDSVKAFHDVLNDGLRVLGNDDIVLKEEQYETNPVLLWSLH